MCLCELDAPPYPSLFIYLIILPHVCTCEERTDHDALGPTGRLTLHPWPPSSAGQTLTLEQMDNGLDALSASGHTLRPPALATALPFTSCCPPFLLLHLSCPAPDCLNSQKKRTCTPLSLCFAISITLFQHFPHQFLPSSDFTYFNPITYFFPFPLFVHRHPCRWIFSQAVYQRCFPPLC